MKNSIGSLGADNSEAYVSNVVVNKVTLIETTNGVRIKTWQVNYQYLLFIKLLLLWKEIKIWLLLMCIYQGGHGMAKNIIFQDIIMKNVTNPIIINQDYCDRVEACPEQVWNKIKWCTIKKITNVFNTIRVIIKLRWYTWRQKSAVQVSNVLYKNIQGTSSRPVAVKFECSKSIPCRGISMQNVKLVDQTQQDVSTASCSNVKLDTIGNVSPLCTWSLLIPKKNIVFIDRYQSISICISNLDVVLYI